MVKKSNNWVILGFFLIGLLAGGFNITQADARAFYGPANQTVYGPEYGRVPAYRVYVHPERRYGPVVTGAPLVGANDAMYERDNIYGPGASAAGRMSHVTKNVPPLGHIYY